MSDLLTKESVKEILVTLKAKELVRFRCVSKSWDSLISSSSFFAYHLNKSTTKSVTEDLHILGYWGFGHITTKVFNLPPDDAKTTFIDALKTGKETRFLPFGNRPTESVPRAIIKGCCNGVLCLKVSQKRYVLWNPSIRRGKLVQSKTKFNFVGFGYDSITCDYKLLGWTGDEVEVFSEKRGSWQPATCGLPYSLTEIEKIVGGIFLNGACHFLCTREIKIRTVYFILAFDFHEELFREIVIPEFLYEYGFPKLLMSHYGSLSMAFSGKGFTMNLEETWGEFETEFLVMKEYGVAESLTEVFNFKQEELLPCSSCLLHRYGKGHVIYFRANNEFLYCCRIEKHLISYDPTTKIEEKSRIKGRSFHCSPYIESLGLLDGDQQEVIEGKLWEKKLMNREKYNEKESL